MDVMRDCVAGLDVHQAMIVACVRRQSDGKAARECRTFDTTTDGLMLLLAWLTQAGCTHVAMEATGVYWKPVWAILDDGAFELILANAAHIKNVPGRKTDVNDAMWIADLLACGLIRPSFVPDAQTQELRALASVPARNSCASRPAIPSASARRSNPPTSSSARWSPTLWGSAAGG